MNAGLADRLMCDYWQGGDGTKTTVQVLCPAIIGREGIGAPWWPHGPCTFHAADGRCEVHAIKPRECAIAGCRMTLSDDQYKAARFSIVRAWNTPRGRALVERWRAERLPAALSHRERAERDLCKTLAFAESALTALPGGVR